MSYSGSDNTGGGSATMLAAPGAATAGCSPMPSIP